MCLDPESEVEDVMNWYLHSADVRVWTVEP